MKIENLNEMKLVNSRRFIWIAWALEFFFCAMGLLAAINMMLSGLEASEESLNNTLIIISGFLPFLVIGLLELTKIPLVQFILTSRFIITRILMLSLLSFFIFLTFENTFSSLEQFFKNVEHPIKQKRLEVKEINQDLILIAEEITSLTDLDPSKIRNDSMLEITPVLDLLEEEIGNLRKREVELQKVELSLEGKEILRQIEKLTFTKEEEIKNHNNEVLRLNNEILSLNKDEQNQLSETFFGKKRVMELFQARRDQIYSEIEILKLDNLKMKDKTNDLIFSLNEELKKLSSIDDNSKKDLENISSQILTLQEQKSAVLDKVNLEIDRKLDIYGNVEAKINSLENQQFILKEKLLDTKKSLALISENNQIHTLAARFYGAESASDLNEKDIQIFTLIIIWSLSIVCSIAGPGLAFAGTRGQMEILPITKKKKPLAKFFKRMYKKIISPKKIIIEKEVEKLVINSVEVPVEKKIFEKIEIPVPYEVTRFVAVPVPTDPNDLPKKVDQMNLFEKDKTNMELVT